MLGRRYAIKMLSLLGYDVSESETPAKVEEKK